MIRASEVGEYVYCARSWWLRRVVGLEPSPHQRRAIGTLRHIRHGQMVFASSILLVLAILFFLVALITGAMIILFLR